MFLTIIVFILILAILVFVHELGHFLMAKNVGMRVDEFGVGFPPRLFSWVKGETRYCINAIPLGGYVKIHGENPQEEDSDPRSFQKQPIRARLVVVVAGVLMNLLFAFAVLMVAFSYGFISPSQDLAAYPGAKIKNTQVIVVEVGSGSPAAQAGLQPGDIVESVSRPGSAPLAVHSTAELQQFTHSEQANGNRQITLQLQRDGVEQSKDITLNQSGVPLGVGIEPVQTVSLPFFQSMKASIREIGYIIDVTWKALGGFLSNLFIHARLDQTVSGPVGIYQATAIATHQGIIPTVFLFVALSINLALLNILPIPALDGGKVVFLVSEAIFRRRVIAEHIENVVSLLSMILLLSLVLAVTVKDIIKIFNF